MRVDTEDGVCRTCKGPLDILDFDDCSMNVACADCGDNYDVETDAFNDGCVKYYYELVLQRRLGDSDEE